MRLFTTPTTLHSFLTAVGPSFRVAVVAGNPKLDMLQLIGYHKHCCAGGESGENGGLWMDGKKIF